MKSRRSIGGDDDDATTTSRKSNSMSAFDSWNWEHITGAHMTVAMAPEVFLELATPLLQPKYTSYELAIKFDEFESMAKTGTLSGPHLMLDKTTEDAELFVTEHEGRTRAMWALSQGRALMAVCLVIKKSAVEHVRAQSKIAFFPQDTATFVDGVPSAIKDAGNKAALFSMGARGASSNSTMNTVLVD